MQARVLCMRALGSQGSVLHRNLDGCACLGFCFPREPLSSSEFKGSGIQPTLSRRKELVETCMRLSGNVFLRQSHRHHCGYEEKLGPNEEQGEAADSHQGLSQTSLFSFGSFALIPSWDL